MIKLVAVTKKDKDLLWNINQKYLYEMTNYYNDPMDEKGNYHYGYFEKYFSDADRVPYSPKVVRLNEEETVLLFTKQ